MTMATRTSSPPGSRSKSTSSSGSSSTGRGSSSTRSRSTGKAPTKRSSASASRSTAKRRPAKGSNARTKRPAPRAVRTGPGPIARVFLVLGRGVATVWLGIAHAVGPTARDLEPEHRRDGAGLFLFGLALVIGAAVWFQLDAPVMGFTRTVVAGSVGKVGWFVPLMLVYIGWRNMRDPQENGPVGRQVVGWAAFGFGILGMVHIANGNPQPVMGDASSLQGAGGAVGFVVSSLLLDLLRTPYVVVPLLALLSFFGVL